MCVGAHLAQEWFRQGFLLRVPFETIEGVPVDARFVGVMPDRDWLDRCWFVFEHASFPEHDPDGERHEITPVLKSHYGRTFEAGHAAGVAACIAVLEDQRCGYAAQALRGRQWQTAASA